MQHKDTKGTNVNDGSQNKKDSAAECLSSCDFDRECKSWTWKTDSKECWLKSCVGANPPAESDNSVSGYCGNFPTITECTRTRTCSGEMQHKDTKGINLNDGHQNLKDSAAECQDSCDENLECKSWTWKTDTRECWLKSCAGANPPEESDDSVSGYCGDSPTAAASSCFGGGGGGGGEGIQGRGCGGGMQHKDTKGTNINDGSQNKKDLAAECLASCGFDRECKSWTWKTDSKECWLKSCVGANPPEESDDSMSGYCGDSPTAPPSVCP